MVHQQVWKDCPFVCIWLRWIGTHFRMLLDLFHIRVRFVCNSKWLPLDRSLPNLHGFYIVDFDRRLYTVCDLVAVCCCFQIFGRNIVLLLCEHTLNNTHTGPAKRKDGWFISLSNISYLHNSSPTFFGNWTWVLFTLWWARFLSFDQEQSG